MANFGPLTAEIGLPVWCTPANFNGQVSRVGFIAATSLNGGQPTLHDVRPSPALVYYTVNHKKGDILFLTITLANINRFLQF